jgi:MFS family permease
MPFAIGNVIGASQSENLTARFGRTVLAVGLGLVAAGITAVWLVLALTTVIGYNGWQLLAPLLIAGVGCGLFIAPTRISLSPRWNAPKPARPAE